MALADRTDIGADQVTRRDGILASATGRMRVEGKFFTRPGQRLRIQGVTYGPFPPAADGSPFPDARTIAADFARMQDIGINAIRTYHVPPVGLLRLADEWGMGVFVDVPWPKHVCFLESDRARREARRLVRRAAEIGRGHPVVLAYSIGNEVPPDIVRWHGARRVERFLAELGDVARQADPDGLVTYANYPPTEYLDLSSLDFVTFNVYLHDREAFRRYLFRLQNLVGDTPLVLGELGMDTQRHGELAQAEFLGGHVQEATLMGLAGAFVFSWTDEWHTGGFAIQDWAFGITHADRSPKAAYHALGEVLGRPPCALLAETPRVSVVVCSYNGGATLAQCLRSLLVLDYPDYEVIVVDDGSTDDTRAITSRFPGVRAIHQANRGLSASRNVGLRAATGAIVAYTDSDCFADPDWLTHLVYQLRRTDASAVGGPNLTPEDGRLAACVAAAPGQPTHVLESDQVAEHVPGCNMAFRREALEAIDGFDPRYRRAGDDVDLCWRLQQAGLWITFAPGAFVWHHRRQGPRTYLRQQAGYGEAEALLWFKHPEMFNGRGAGKWRGVLYGPSSRGLRLGAALIHRGTFGTGLFQCLYRPGPAHWAMLPGTLEWHLAIGLIGLIGLSSSAWAFAGVAMAVMLGLSAAVAGLQAAQARLAPEHEGIRSRLLIAALCYVQPLVRSWSRYRVRLLSAGAPRSEPPPIPGRQGLLAWTGPRTVAYWSEDRRDRTELLDLVVAYFKECRWGLVLDSGWSEWDLEIWCHSCAVLRVGTVQEDHGGGKRLIRIRYRLRATTFAKTTGIVLLACLAASAGPHPWVAAFGVGIMAVAAAHAWWRGVAWSSRAMGIFDAMAGRMHLIPCAPPSEPGSRARRCDWRSDPPRRTGAGKRPPPELH
jgi:GT2 family glycosyltransferase